MEEKGSKKMIDLTKAVECSQEAVDLRALYLNNLDNRLNTRYGREEKQEEVHNMKEKRSKKISHKQSSTIKYDQEAIDLTPKENPDRVDRLNNLSTC